MNKEIFQRADAINRKISKIEREIYFIEKLPELLSEHESFIVEYLFAFGKELKDQKFIQQIGKPIEILPCDLKSMLQNRANLILELKKELEDL